MTKARTKPACLVFAGHDPSGGAGIQADIETLAALGCIALPVITCLTTQNTKTFIRHRSQAPTDVSEQATLVVRDMTVSACKIGAIGSAKVLDAIHTILSDLSVPVVLDPVLFASVGHVFNNAKTRTKIGEQLVPLATVITPNRKEALCLTCTDNPEAAAQKLLDMGCQTVLITDVDESLKMITDHVFYCDGMERRYTTPRLPGDYHGSGCTLSAAIAAELATGRTVQNAITAARDFTYACLEHSLQLGQGSRHPNRMFGRCGEGT